jgi:hypothetical protein
VDDLNHKLSKLNKNEDPSSIATSYLEDKETIKKYEIII